ncbi:MAG: PIN domain-containing protein [Rhodothermaceae bacterium]|nr:PIN domain-containing protein [Bacteroidota bacterium]MXW15221.1 PIN domain-containing protein [Rhodothermaceae bacterium]MDE2646785.1 PIN domain-containing protein [Bacteroidota bacterium]MXX97464.1 PIN domain-containing protein [Rhodothermaceae bacterium]MXZ58768.1 PIN domain-containing protein [Rhodothermaceae bacterium]
MCAILDANVVHEVFKVDGHDAGKQFLEWINTGRGHLVIGGKLTAELSKASESFRQWAKIARIQGKMTIVHDGEVDQTEKDLTDAGNCISDDTHIIALAQVSGARLLYSNDEALHKDFGNKKLIDHPRGKIYSTIRGRDFSKTHRDLLANRNLCGAKS